MATSELEETALIQELSKSTTVTFEESIAANSKTHAVHCMIYADWNDNVLGLPAIAAVLMQMRFDGHLGFPGGEVDTSLIGVSSEDAKLIILDALVRELHEEMNVTEETLKISHDNYLFTHQRNDLYLHFYACKVPIEKIQHIERNIFNCEDYSKEVMGIFRVPLFTMKDEFRGFPAFLNNAFIGTSKNQLLSALATLEIMPRKELNRVILASENNVLNVLK